MIDNRPDCACRASAPGRADHAVHAARQWRSASAHRRFIEAVAARVERDGIDAWFALDPAELLAPRPNTTTRPRTSWTCGPIPACPSNASRRCAGIFHSPVDLYLEGSDSIAAGSNSSILMSEALYGRAPYRGVLTHGFTVDVQGRKMSKSLGNASSRRTHQDPRRRHAAAVGAATDFSNEMSLSQEILRRMSDSYRRMRNTVRFLLGNLHGFEPAQALPLSGLVALDAWAVERTRELQAEIEAAYRDYQFT